METTILQDFILTSCLILKRLVIWKDRHEATRLLQGGMYSTVLGSSIFGQAPGDYEEKLRRPFKLEYRQKQELLLHFLTNVSALG